MILLRIVRGAIDDCDREFIALVTIEQPATCVLCGEAIGTGARAFFSDRKGFAHPRQLCPTRGLVRG